MNAVQGVGAGRVLTRDRVGNDILRTVRMS
jgi:hypothetical protein